jgi:hypothetical protein
MRKIDYGTMSKGEIYQMTKSISMNPTYRLKMADHDYEKTNPLSKLPGGAIVVIVDHKNKRETAYPNIKNVNPYIDKLERKFDPSMNFCKSIDEIYYITPAYVIKKK